MYKEDGLHTIVKRLTRDDKSALDEIYNIYYPRLYSFSKSFLKTSEDIPDILQEVFVKLWLNRHHIKNVETFNAWMYTITRNLIISYFRKKIKDREYAELIRSRALYEENYSDDQEYSDLKAHLDRIVLQLPEKRRHIFLLSREEGLSHREIAEKMDISVKTVEDHITHAIRFIKGQLKDMDILTILFLTIFL